jgi:hypothetical protein
MRPAVELRVDGPSSFRNATRRSFRQKSLNARPRLLASATVAKERAYATVEPSVASKPKCRTISQYVTHGVFVSFLLVILGFAATDTYLNIKYPVKDKVEENPIAKWILQQSNNDLGLLIAIKLIGTNLAITLLTLYYRHNKGKALVASGSVAGCVIAMLVYMVTC